MFRNKEVRPHSQLTSPFKDGRTVNSVQAPSNDTAGSLAIIAGFGEWHGGQEVAGPPGGHFAVGQIYAHPSVRPACLTLAAG